MQASGVRPLVAFAPAKVNLTLRVLRRRPDGYHELESLVVFADVGDRVSLAPGGALELVVRGPTASGAGADENNLVLKAARALADRVPGIALGRFVLDKRLPVAAGLGGGSSDAAAALRLLAQANALRLDDPRMFAAAAATGSDVPVCLDPRPRMMRGIGRILSEPVDAPALPAVLVNPGVAVSTRDVFTALDLRSVRHTSGTPPPGTALFDWIARGENDLESPAARLQPTVKDVLAKLAALPGIRLARMSGSGATCFALFHSRRAAETAARQLRTQHPRWWVRATILGAGDAPQAPSLD